MEIGVRIVGFVLILLDFLTKPLFWLKYRKPARRLPPIREPILYESATSLARKIRERRVSSVSAVRAFVDRVKEVNPLLNAVVEERFDAALEEAERADRTVAGVAFDEAALAKLATEKPLFGVPITVKESCTVSGMSQSVGSIPRIGVKGIRDSTSVSLLRASGAIPILVSNTPEFCLSWETDNLVTGRTNNPYCLHRTSGGSSGGEAALIASGASVVGVASDIAGSIRIPAHFTGIFGHKPTPGVVSVEGHFPMSTDEDFGKFLTMGPLTRYAEDLAPMLRIMAGKEAHRLGLDAPVDMKRLKVCYMRESGKSAALIPVDEEIGKALAKAVDFLRDKCGCQIDETKFLEMEDSVDISVSLFFGMRDIPELLRDESDPKVKKNLYLELVKSAFGASLYSIYGLAFYLLRATNLFIPKSSRPEYVERAKRLKSQIETTLGDNGVFLYPTFPVPAIYHNQTLVKMSGVMYTMIFNILGLPSTHVPLGLNSKLLPMGIQVVAASNQDRLCLAVAKELEKGFGGWVSPCG